MRALPPTDLHLARRLERAEAMANVAFVEARASVTPSVGATWTDIAGVYAMFDGVGSPLTQTFGLGLFDSFLTPEFDRAEGFFTERGSATHHEVCQFAPEATARLLPARGYTPIEQSVVLLRTTEPGASRSASGVTVRRVEAHECDDWARISAQGWSSEGPEIAAFVEQFGAVTARARGVHCFLAEIDGLPVAAGALNLSSDVALLAGASTAPAFRRLGAQRALLDARLAYAASLGIDIAMIVTLPGSASMRNAEHQGFAPVCTRTKWERALP